MGNSSANPNRVRDAREALGLSQVALAEASGLTRQSIGAIEAGRATPAVDVAIRIARVLDRSVEELFGAPQGEETILTEASSHAPTGRLAVAHLGGRWVSHSLERDGIRTSADAIAGAVSRRGLEGTLLRPPSEARDNVFLMGCAAGIGVLADRMNASRGSGRFIWLPRSSTDALEALAKDRTHVAGVHLVDKRTGDENVADVRRIVRDTPVALITLARWEVGLVVPAGNPKRIRAAADLARRGLKLVVREKGSGARRLLDQELDSAGVGKDLAESATLHAAGHLETAQAVALGAGDTGIASRDAAIAFGLDLVPLSEERYDLAVRAGSVDDPRVQRLLDGLSSAWFRRELSSLGYDVSASGTRVTAA